MVSENAGSDSKVSLGIAIDRAVHLLTLLFLRQ